ncbi:uncharacterized protein A1O9_06391 [Exophiala aquamarina CBS 119918]|uniref:FAD dependent oxidoreductase domain-containing protein n=1 Tax=Exophiala aquamarina CBS 119918 TaxID=1182545 RepID=A0A072PSG1_9EURO|nr:uncharacterized protein A1O9_06391 [Exophiala aquamarina CBS 119918]KEF58465.1 hypothetical protein A1O9_06391 [Exophiala aquamarina CBS 119918]
MIAENPEERRLSNFIPGLEAQLCADPQLPRPNPTESFWQLPPHATLSEAQSETLSETIDIAIIGSGVTGCSVAKNLLDLTASSSQSFSITVFEARTLTSGATGRNGGLLSSFVPGDYSTLSENFGHEQAIKIARYANRTLDKMYELGRSSEEAKKLSEVRNLVDVIGFEDEGSFNGALESLRLYEEHVPEGRGQARILNAQEVESEYNMRAAAGAIVCPNGAFWPYRLITHTWEQLCSQYKSRLSIETRTPVTKIMYDVDTDPIHPYALHTSRGMVRASKIVHATNGYTGHLLPQLRGKIYPLRGTMSTQKSTPAFGHHGHALSWSMINSGHFDSTTGIVEAGLYYSNQNPHTNDIFIGGEKTKIDELFISDDTEVGGSCIENISGLLPRFFTKGWNADEQPEVIKVWSGIMGFTADHLPLIGQLPKSITNRGEEGNGGEYIAAGFNGYGMPLCWSSGEAVAKMLLGIDVSDFLPEVFLVDEQRLQDPQRMSTKAALTIAFGR